MVRDSKDHDEAVCDDNGENWMCRTCYDEREEKTCDGCDEVSVNVKYNLTFAVTLCDGCFERQFRKCDCCDMFLPIDDDGVFVGTCPECATMYGNMCCECNDEFCFTELIPIDDGTFICKGCQKKRQVKKPKLKIVGIYCNNL